VRNDGSSLISDLQAKTDAAHAAALADAKRRATAALAAYTSYAAPQGDAIPADTTAAAQQWPAQLAAGTTPAAFNEMAMRWTSTLPSTKAAVAAGRSARIANLLGRAGGRAGLVATAQTLARTADADNLDSKDVQRRTPPVASEPDQGQGPTKADEDLFLAVNALQDVVDLNDNIGRQMRPTYLSVLQAQAEGTSSAAKLNDHYQQTSAAFQAGRTNVDLTAVQAQVASLQNDIAAELRASNCGHNVPGGKVITINLTVQEMLFFQDGCVVEATPVSSGRPELRTPTGSYRIFSKQSPFLFHSPWPKSSPFWYPDSPATWVMEFAGGGYFIHDAPWESEGAYGPGSEISNYSASHGCVHTPTSVMQWAYSWTAYGTPVIINY